jgi:polyisoprenoid-binding protein YceI
MKIARYLITAAIAIATPAAARDLVFNLDPTQTTVQFTLGATFHTVHGSFKLERGTISFDPETGKASGEVVVDAASGESGSKGRDRRMHEKIIESSRYPEIVFTPDRVEGKVALEGASQVQVHGLFKIHGAEHEIVLPMRVQMAPRQMTATTQFEIPYVKWGMKNPSTLFLRVSDKVDIEIHAVGQISR